MSIPWLNARSHFSLGESLAEPDRLVTQAAELGLSGVLLADTMSVTGMPELFTAAKKAGIKPMIGVRLRIVQELERERKPKHKPYYLRALVLDQRGWDAVLGLLSTAFDEEHFYAVPRLLLSDVVGAASGGGLALTLGDAYGALPAGRGVEVAQACRDASVPLYADVPLADTPLAVRLAKEALLLQDEGIPSLLAPQALYHDPSEADSLDMMMAIAGNRPWDELSARRPWRQAVLLSPKDLTKPFVDMEEALGRRYGGPAGWCPRMERAWEATETFPDQVSFTWDKQKPSLPVMAPNEFQALVEGCKQGWTRRFAGPVFGHTPANLEVYKARLKYELEMIRKLDFSAYFLLVAEIVGWAKQNGIGVGPGRGSVGGSLIAYLLGITDVDPIRFGLLFERFINPERIDLPDADLDFASLRRQEVVQRIVDRFGRDQVAGVVNYNTMQAAGALNDVCRMLGVKADMAFSKIVPKEHGQSWDLEQALEEVPEIAKFAAAHPEVVRHARNLEGHVRAFGKHAAGIIVAGVPVRERAVIERRNGDQVINWDKRLAEDFGLVKMDVLGLKTLDMIQISTEEAWRMRARRLDLLATPLDDPETLAAFGRGETVGVFQFESPGMRKLLKDLAEREPLTFEDLAVATSLYRPGPMDSGLMDDFIKIRQGKKQPRYDHPSMEEALRETKGVMVYQEQVMQVARDFAGFSLPESDHLRKAMGKKDKEKMAGFRTKFVDGAVALHGVHPSLAERIFDQIAKFAAYGFNKSHAVEYALISYLTMWLKVHHPIEFWAGVLSMIKEDRHDAALADMHRMGIKLLPPDVNNSTDRFVPLNDTALLAPLSAVKGVSERTAQAIVEARKVGPFLSMKDFESRVGGRACNSGQREKLNLVGAFARIEPGQLPADHADRRRNQVELMPGLVLDAVLVDRQGLDLSTTALTNLQGLINDWRACERCDLKGLCHPRPWLRGHARMMIVLDGPSWKEERQDEMGYGGHAEAIEVALKSAGLSMEDVYITALVKTPKPEKAKEWPTATLGACPSWLEDEIRILRPPVIVLLGSKAFQHFFKGLKGGVTEHAGKVHYDKGRDLNIVVGFNPGSIYFNPEKQENLDDILQKAVALLPS